MKAEGETNGFFMMLLYKPIDCLNFLRFVLDAIPKYLV
jgi:hypothetical protein